ncbi:MAG: cytochrome c peroxidase [Pseudomonadota bacterium]
MKRSRRLLWAGLAIGIGLSSVLIVRERVERNVVDAPKFEVPKNWPAPQYDFKNNPVTAEGFALGRKLFYDAQLSRDGSVSCGSCHQQFAAFAQLDHRVSHGIGGVNGKRNAPGLFNLAWQPQMMWDGAATHLETQPILPISNPLEMGETLSNIIDKLKADKSYAQLFEQAFGTPGIDSQRTLRALAQFTGSLVSSHSRYDGYVAGEEKLSADETAGLKLFRQNCAACHREPLFTDYSYRSNGLDAQSEDEGRKGVTAKPEDHGLFRVPSLRNIALTSPYMHDGRFTKLEQVLEHYDHGVAKSSALDPLLAKGIPLNPQQRRELLSFLNTLTDQQFISDVRFAEIDPAKSVKPSLLGSVFGPKSQADILPVTRVGRSRLVLQSADVELVLVHELEDLVIYADDFGSNTPLKGLDLSVHISNRLLRAAEDGDGTYRIPAERIDFTQPQAIKLTLQGSGLKQQLQGTLPGERLQ